jgi:hypothetical protein
LSFVFVSRYYILWSIYFFIIVKTGADFTKKTKTLVKHDFITQFTQIKLKACIIMLEIKTSFRPGLRASVSDNRGFDVTWAPFECKLW